jgi:hypothetical protein
MDSDELTPRQRANARARENYRLRLANMTDEEKAAYRAKKQAAHKRHYEAHKEEENARSKAWAVNNRDKANALARRKRAARKEHYSALQRARYVKNKGNNWHDRNAERHSENNHKWQKQNAEYVSKHNYDARAPHRARLFEAKTALGGCCQMCENTDFRVLQFDHMIPGEKVCMVTCATQSDTEFFEEVAKCQLLCANCRHLKTHYSAQPERDIGATTHHMDEHGKMMHTTANAYTPDTSLPPPKRTRVREAHRQRIDNAKVKLGGCCRSCGTSDFRILQFDHIIPDDKLMDVTQMEGSDDLAFSEEVAKCQLLCANCHHLKTRYTIAPQNDATSDDESDHSADTQ